VRAAGFGVGGENCVGERVDEKVLVFREKARFIRLRVIGLTVAMCGMLANTGFRRERRGNQNFHKITPVHYRYPLLGKFPGTQFLSEPLRSAPRQRDISERWVLFRIRREDGRVSDEQIGHIMALAISVHHGSLGIPAHPGGAYPVV